jgi:hypothetical protein
MEWNDRAINGRVISWNAPPAYLAPLKSTLSGHFPTNHACILKRHARFGK